MNKITTLIVIGLSVILPFNCYANIANGTSGTCKWVIDDNGVLTISPSKGKVGKLEKWEDWRSGVSPWHKYRSKITHVKFEKKIYTETCSAMFMDCELLETVDFGQFNIDASDNMEYMFSGCKSLKEIDMSTLNTDNVVHMNNMFANCTSIKSIDLSTFDTYKVKTMGMMFYNCTSLEYVDVARWHTLNVEEMQYMFFNCKKLKKLNLHFWDMRGVVNTTSMFDNCVCLENIDMRYFATYAGTMKNTFRNCQSLESLNLTAFMGGENDSDGFFKGCDNLKKFYAYNKDPFMWTINEDIFREIKEPEKIILYVPRASVELYKSAPGWKIFDVRAMEDEPKESSDNTDKDNPEGKNSNDSDDKPTGNPVTGVDAITTSCQSSTVYTLSGKRLVAPRKGINIVNGKKYFVK